MLSTPPTLQIRKPSTCSRRLPVLSRPCYFSAAVSPAYLRTKLTRPLPTKDGGTLRTFQDVCDYMAAIGNEREQRRHWQQVRQLILEEADESVVSWQIRLAVLKDAKLDVSAMNT
jgi:hypothetical protein